MRHDRLPAALFATLLAVVASSPAQQLTPDKVLRIHFRVNLPYNQTPNTLKLNFGLTSVQQAYGTRRAALYHCDRLLGSYSSTLFGNYTGNLNLDPGASWKSPTSPWTFDNGAPADFTSIQNGTILGVIDYTIDAGAMTIPLNQVNVNMINATGSSGGGVVSPNPTVTDVAIVPKLTLPMPGGVNTINAWNVTGALPNSLVFLGVGTQCYPLSILGVVYDVANPLVFFGIPTDAFGAGSFQAFVPASAAGGRLLMQGIQISAAPNYVVTNLSAYTF